MANPKHPREVHRLIAAIARARRWGNVEAERQARSELDRLMAMKHLAEAERLLRRANASEAAS